MTMTQPTPLATPQTPLVARAGSYYRNVRYLMAAGMVVFGLWFGYDGFIGWPAKNAAYDRIVAEHEKGGGSGGEQSLKTALEAEGVTKRYSDLELLIQKLLSFSLPVGGVTLLVWMLYNSRGEYRFDGKTLSMPGHPSIDVDSISAVDRKLWDRKGIAFIEYARPGGTIGKARLDDFVYERGPTDAIYKQLVAGFEETPETTPGRNA